MANLSSAHGTLTITAPSNEIIEDFLAHIIKPWEDSSSDYTPYINPDRITNEGAEPVEGNSSTAYSFSAIGRWAWLDILHNIEAHLAPCVGAEDMNRLTSIDGSITATWEFADVEESCEVLYRATVETLFKDGKVTVRTVNDTDYPYTKENYVALGFDADDWCSDEEDEELED